MFVSVNTTKRNWSIDGLAPDLIGFMHEGEMIEVSPGPVVSLMGDTYPLYRHSGDGATITDHDRGLIYEARIEQQDGRQWLKSLTIMTTKEGQRIDQSVMRSIPVQRIAEQVSLHLAAEQEMGTMMRSDEPWKTAHDGPTTEQVADDYRAGLSRSALATKYHASVFTIDKRIREARDAGLIDPATTGRKRNKTSDATTRRTNERNTK